MAVVCYADADNLAPLRLTHFLATIGNKKTILLNELHC